MLIGILAVITVTYETGNIITEREIKEHIEYLEREYERLNVKVAEYEQIIGEQK